MRKRYTKAPKSDLLGNAGNSGPNDREIRYTSYVEKERQEKPSNDQT